MHFLLKILSNLTKSFTCMILRYIFFGDKVEIQDITKLTSLFVLVGPKSGQVRDIIIPIQSGEEQSW